MSPEMLAGCLPGCLPVNAGHASIGIHKLPTSASTASCQWSSVHLKLTYGFPSKAVVFCRVRQAQARPGPFWLC